MPPTIAPPMLTQLISSYGSVLVAAVIALECMGIPLPGEAVLIGAALYAGTSHSLDIREVVIAAALGGTVGNIGGYALGRAFGYPLLVRYGHLLRLTESRIKIGRYLFARYGVTMIVLVRFVAGLRSIGGILAGANRMPLVPFLLASAVGAFAWAGVCGAGAYLFGDHIHTLAAPAAIVVVIAAAIAIVVGGRALARREHELAKAAERAFPGPLGG